MALAGSTITINATFPPTIDNLDSMTNVRIHIYTPDRTLLQTLTGATKVSTGVYSIKYTVTYTAMPLPLTLEMVGTVDGFDYLGSTTLVRSYS